MKNDLILLYKITGIDLVVESLDNIHEFLDFNFSVSIVIGEGSIVLRDCRLYL